MKIPYVEHDGRVHYQVDSETSVLPQSVIRSAIIKIKWSEIRTRRDAALRACDYAVMPDYPLTDAQKTEVTAYRQALRDIPETAGDPDAVEWPETPEVLA